VQATPNLQSKLPHRTILAIAAPAILANSSAPLVGLVDTWAIGHLPGATYLAAIGLGSVIFNFIFWAFGFLRMGTTGIIAQGNGKGDQDLLIAGIWRSMALALGLGIILLLLQEIILLIAIGAFAPPVAVTGLMEEYFHIRIWAAPATLMVYAISGVLFGLGKTGAVLFQQLVQCHIELGLRCWTGFRCCGCGTWNIDRTMAGCPGWHLDIVQHIRVAGTLGRLSHKGNVVAKRLQKTVRHQWFHIRTHHTVDDSSVHHHACGWWTGRS